MGEILGYFLQLSFATFLTIFLFSSIIICIVYVIFKDNSYLHNMGIHIFPFCLAILGVRLFIPLELRYSKSFYFTGIYHTFTRFFQSDRFSVGSLGISIMDIFFIVIFIGIIVNLIKFIKGYRTFCNLIFVNSIPFEENDKNILDKVLLTYNGKRDFELIRSEIISTPVIFGLIRPCIVLSNQDYDSKQLEYILSHEVAHYYRKDLWTKFLVQLACIIYWWNPFIYLLKDDIAKFLEIRTDLAVTKRYGAKDKSAYAECILKVFKDISLSGKMITDNVIAFGNDDKAVIKQRVNMVLDTYKPSIWKKILVIMPMIIMLCASYLVVLEPTQVDISTREIYSIDRSTSYVVENKNGTFDLYVFDEYDETVDDLKYNYNQVEDAFGRIHNSMLNLNKYKSYEEAINDEKRFD